MKWKMPSNSLYAVLLRSPWWVSMLVVLAILLVCGALLPAPYRPFGMLASLPFLGIGLYRAWRQGQAPNPKRVAHALERAGAMPWREFSAVLQQAYEHQGYAVTPLSGPAADFKLSLAGRTTLVSGKRWKAAAHGVDPLRELLVAKEHHGADLCSYICLGSVSESAQRFARQSGITLVSGEALASLILSHV
jgi:restriction system protein